MTADGRCRLCLVLTLALPGCARTPPADVLPTVRIAVHRDPVAFLPLRVAESLGYYRDDGIAVEMTEVAGGTKAIEALLGGSVDVAAGSMSDALQLAAEGRPIRGFLVLYTRPSLALAVSPLHADAIHGIRDLRGRPVGVSTPGSTTHQLINYLLVQNGLLPEDVSVVSIGMSASSVAAVEHGTVDAAVLIAGAIAAFEDRHPEGRLLADTRTPEGARRVFGAEAFPALSLLSQDDWLQHHADAARRLVRAVKRGMLWVRDHPATQVREMMPESARAPNPAVDLRAIRVIQDGISPDGLMPPGSASVIERFVAVSNPRVRAAHVDLARLYTNDVAAVK